MIRDLNRIILGLAPRHIARDVAPSTFPDLMNDNASALTVWSGASDATIFGDARVNHAFRAWHDATHKRFQFHFTLSGERATCEAQCRQLLALHPRALPLAEIIRCEVIGQAEHFAKYGVFPLDQLAFSHAYLTAKGIRI